jgi:outer membrane protein OmpA-like peptidoglycan-associated protein
VTGTAPHRWIVETRLLVRALPGIVRLQEDGLQDADIRALETAKENIERLVLRFVRGTTQLVPGQAETGRLLAARIRDLFEHARVVSREVRVDIIGHSDTHGSEADNRKLSQDRATSVLASLQAQGLPTSKLTTAGVGATQPVREELTEQDRELNRSASFAVVFPEPSRGG